MKLSTDLVKIIKNKWITVQYRTEVFMASRKIVSIIERDLISTCSAYNFNQINYYI